MRITFHVKKYTVTIIIAETHKKDRVEKTSATLPSDGSFCGLMTTRFLNF